MMSLLLVIGCSGDTAGGYIRSRRTIIDYSQDMDATPPANEDAGRPRQQMAIRRLSMEGSPVMAVSTRISYRPRRMHRQPSAVAMMTAQAHKYALQVRARSQGPVLVTMTALETGFA